MKKKIVIGLIIVIAVGSMIAFNLNKNKGSSLTFGRGKAYDVEAKVIETAEISSKVIVNGQVEEVSKEDIYFESPVVISEILVAKGDSVKAGDILMKIDLLSLESEREQLLINQQVQSLQLAKLKAMSQSQNATSLDVAVKLAEINLEAANALNLDQISNNEKNIILFEEGIISQSELDASQKMVSDTNDQVTVAKLNLNRSQSDLNNYWTTTVENQQLDIEIQTMNLEGITLSIEKLDEQINKANEAVICPIDGVVTDINAIAGTVASTIQPVMTVVDTNQLKIVADIREYDVKDIELGQPIVIEGDAIIANEEVTGTVSYIAPIAQQVLLSGNNTTTVNIEISISEGIEFLKPGYSTDCEITTMYKEDAIVASYDMFKEDKDGSKYIFVIDENEMLRKQPVELGITSDFDAEIVEGLSVGDRVVINPSLVLKEGSLVNVIQEPVK